MTGPRPGTSCRCKYCKPAPQTKINEQHKKSSQKVKERLQAARIAGKNIKRNPNAVNEAAFVRVNSNEEEEYELDDE
jgi:hypothetical protein